MGEYLIKYKDYALSALCYVVMWVVEASDGWQEIAKTVVTCLGGICLCLLQIRSAQEKSASRRLKDAETKKILSQIDEFADGDTT